MIAATPTHIKFKVYIAGPITLGDHDFNVRQAIDAADKIALAGHTPFVPHINALWGIVYNHSREFWYEWDNEWLKVCDVLIRLPGDSSGADQEVKFAQEHGIPVFTLEEFIAFYTTSKL